MKDFQHPNVLGLLGVVFDTPDGVPYLVLPFMKNGNLKDYLKSRRVEASDIDTLPQVSITMFRAICFTILQQWCRNNINCSWEAASLFALHCLHCYCTEVWSLKPDLSTLAPSDYY